MKVLHIGKTGNLQRFAVADGFLRSLELTDLKPGLPVKEYLDQAGDADFIVVDAISSVPGELIKQMPNLKVIHSEGVAYNAIDLKAADDCGVYVCNAKGMNAMAVAEQAVLLMVGMLRNVVVNDAAVRNGHQIETKEGYMQNGNLYELADCSVGLIGFGDIAQKTARLLKAYGVKEIYYYKRHRLDPEQEQQFGVQYRELDDLLASSRIVSLHLPVTDATMHMADHDFFAKMQPGSYLVNTARGELVDDAALIEALKSGRLAMAGLDTLDHEPVQSDHPLLNLPFEIAQRLLFSPHIGGITAASFYRGYAMIEEDLQLAAQGKRPKRVVNSPK
ncbi:NAD(P)-dependent oxidoreductase [Limosilactobacillus mucosae]|uniref:NAD(P)-dependent oxidoreductase n=1 Tax=Limosilactobacillus mucosae TaxID=97478 RepID=UPI00233ED876|nr:NAD(P)-dependent oxidoreductase [Limosilactobacillus mucosae]MDC2839788.1 NAD(P)-dependent oxidoreductase [Limosilactobacillus mucosae]